MRVLALQHVAFEHLGSIAKSLADAGLQWDCLDVFSDDLPEISLDRFCGVVVMGGPMSANDGLEEIAAEVALLRRALGRGMPVLGVCLGSQLIAKALGASVYRNARREIGWGPVHWTEAAASDDLFAGFRAAENVFHWHGETFDLPAGATRLAWSDACRNQGFRAGRGVYGLQFHLEVTPDMIEDWMKQPANRADLQEHASPIDPAACADGLREAAELVFGRWARMAKRFVQAG